MTTLTLKSNFIQFRSTSKKAQVDPRLYTSVYASHFNPSTNNSFVQSKQRLSENKLLNSTQMMRSKQVKTQDTNSTLADIQRALHPYNSSLFLNLKEEKKHKRCSSIKSLYLSVR